LNKYSAGFILVTALMVAIVGATVVLADHWPGLAASGNGRAIAPGATSPDTKQMPITHRRSYVIAGAGDIACDPKSPTFNGGYGTPTACAQMRTSDLLLQINPDVVFTVGDNQYEDGTLENFLASYDPSWGRLKSITRPAAGNHEYHVPGATGYFDYFGSQAGDRATGYYAYDLGDWRLYVVNSNCAQVGGCGAGSPQEQWLREDLVANPRACSLAYWHHPRFSSGSHGHSTSMQAIWRALYDHRADVVIAGHDHIYERFARLNAMGNLDSARGIRSFVAGMGGKNLYSFNMPAPGSEVRNADTFGVLTLVLHDGSYEWEFVPVAGGSFTDSGSEPCR
jgi:acid phosphatase type 7